MARESAQKAQEMAESFFQLAEQTQNLLDEVKRLTRDEGEGTRAAAALKAAKADLRRRAQTEAGKVWLIERGQDGRENR